MSHVQSTGIPTSHWFRQHNAEKHFVDYRLILHVSASALVERLVTQQSKSFNT